MPAPRPTTTTTTTTAQVPSIAESLAALNASLAEVAESQAKVLDRYELACKVDDHFKELVEAARKQQEQ